MKRRISIIFIMAIASLSPLSYAKTLHLATFEHPPYEYTENSILKGIVVNLVTRVFNDMDQPIDIQVLPWARAITDIKEGKLDALFTAFKKPEREEFIDFSNQVLMQQTVSLYARKDAHIEFDGSLAPLKGYRFGVVRKISYGQILDKALKENRFRYVEETNDAIQNFQLLLNHRVDIVPSIQHGGSYILNHVPDMNQIKELDTSVQNIPSYMAFSKANGLTEIRDKFDRHLAQLKASGEYQKIIDDYFKN